MFLGICDGHDSGAALLDTEGRVVFAVSEERLSRRKRQPGFPALSVEACLARSPEIHRVAVAERAGRLPFRLLDPLYRRSNPDVGTEGMLPRGLLRYSQAAARYLPGPESALAERILRRRLRGLGVDAPVILVDHHRCHARTAAAGRADSLVLTLDAFGDGLSGTLHRGDAQGGLERVAALPAPLGPAHLFARTTRFLGFAEGDEGKVVARAAAGNPALLREHFTRALSWDGRRFRSGLTSAAFLAGLADHRAHDIAAALQARTEELVAAILDKAIEHHGGSRLCLAGGLFANVAVNRVALEIAEARGLEEVFVFPAMGDAGLCVGAAMEALVLHGGSPAPLRDPRVGPRPAPLSESGSTTLPILHSLQGQDGEMDSASRSAVVGALTTGRPVATCRGPLEFGPRALGGRSLLLSPDNEEHARQLNLSLGRDQAMPFGPVMTEEAAPDLLTGWSSCSRDLTALMTVALPATERLRRLAPAAVHKDGTARAQVLGRSFDPDLHAVLQQLPGQVCINTSLNLHGEPIVAGADQAARSARRAGAALLWLD
ncbi:MAG: carbamoyltransferase C-terminal domain-containing protein [Myxococcota bacterium]|nr:carbamoyltransferase C-terminal domain-containing protein [Myxococcota bacterium]